MDNSDNGGPSERRLPKDEGYYITLLPRRERFMCFHLRPVVVPLSLLASLVLLLSATILPPCLVRWFVARLLEETAIDWRCRPPLPADRTSKGARCDLERKNGPSRSDGWLVCKA